MTPIEYLAPEGVNLVPAHPSDAGVDLSSREEFSLVKGDVVYVDTGVKVALPYGTVGMIVARSSLHTHSLRLANGVGIIDSGYRGSLILALEATADTTIFAGQRLCQLVVLPLCAGDFTRVDSLPDSDRGEGKFGSTGTGR